MSACIPNAFLTVVPAARGKNTPAPAALSVGVFSLPTDPLFYADLTLENIVVGSRYRITRRDNGDELAAGVAASATEVLAGLAVFANPMPVDITVRNASGTPTYRIFDTSASLYKAGGSAYILQQLDE